MTKSELINRIYKNTKHFSVVDVESAVKAILKTLNTAISTGQRVEPGVELKNRVNKSFLDSKK